MIAIALLVAYLALMIGIGVWGMRKTANVQDFFLGGRTIGPFVSALSYGTTYFSAVLFIGFAGKLGWGFGLNALWIAFGNAVAGSLLAWLILGHRTRVMTHNLGSMTMPEFFEARYGSAGLRMLSAVIIFIFLLPYSASVYKGLGHLFEANFQISYLTALALMTVITGIYLVIGGYFAVTLTDFIQGLIMLVGAMAMVAILVSKGGGLGATLDLIRTNYPQHVPAAGRPGALALGSLVFMTSFGVFGMPQMVQKFYAIKNEQVIKTAALVTTLFAAVITFSAYFTGAMTHVFFTPATLPLANGKPAFDELVPTMLAAHLPPLLMAVILILVLAASMSTLSSLVLVSASSIAIDLYPQHKLSASHGKKSLLMLRGLSGVFVILSLVLAIYPFGIIVTLMSLSWGVVAGSFMAVYLYGLFWKRATVAGAWAGMITGLAVGIGLFFWLGPAQGPLAASLAMIIPLAVVPGVSLLTAPPEGERIQRAFAGLGKAPGP
jgi:solute:Na+ symporter, SSS family